MNVLEMAYLRRILGSTQRDRLYYSDVKKHLHLQKGVTYRILQWCLRYFDHVMRMNDGRYPKIAQLRRVHGTKQRGRPIICWIDSIKEDCGTLGMTITQASRTAQDRNNWRTAINGLPRRASALPGHK